jgi:hypothetical protein
MTAPLIPDSLWAATAEGTWPPATERDEVRLLERAGREGLLPLLFEAPGLSPSLRQRLERQRGWQRLARARAQIVADALGALGRILHDEPFVVLKGADYMGRLYPRPELRPMQDIDLLVPRSRIDHACARLEAAGLQRRAVPGAARAAPSYYERAFLLGDVIVEVHQSFLQRSRHRVDYEGLWSRRRPAPELAPTAARLEEADAVAYHTLALAKDEFTTPLIRYVDLWLMLGAWPQALREGAARAREWRAARAFYGALHQAARFFPELGEGEAAEVARRMVGPVARRFLARYVLPPREEQGRAGVVTRSRQLWRKFWLMDGMRSRLAFAARHAEATLQGWRGRPR